MNPAPKQTMERTMARIKEAVINRQRNEIQEMIKGAVDGGIDPDEIINQGLIPAMDQVGKLFAENKIFVPEMLVSAMTMKIGLEVVKPLLKGDALQSKGTIIIGTVKGDLHDIGKNLVTMMLEGAGFEVIDLGVDLTTDTLMEEVVKTKPDVLGLSALLTTTMPEMEKVIQALNVSGLKDKVRVMVGGAPVDRSFAERIGADGYGADAAEAVKLAQRFMDEKV
jgi:corrinoid protein of di/trimethylamine methyltransferase